MWESAGHIDSILHGTACQRGRRNKSLEKCQRIMRRGVSVQAELGSSPTCLGLRLKRPLSPGILHYMWAFIHIVNGKELKEQSFG